MKTNNGFTLIELLVVIAVIGLLSTVVLASLNSARKKAKDAAIRQEIAQLSLLMVLNYDDYGSYCQLQNNNWIASWGPTYTCDTFPSLSGNYAAKFRDECKVIVSNAYDIFATAGAQLFFAGVSSSFSCNTSYSFMAGLNNGNWYCSGSGGKGEYSAGTSGSPGFAGKPGCWDNP